MIWADKTHTFSATACRHTGQPCPAAARMLRKLAEAMTAARPMTDGDFEISGTTTLTGCPGTCTAQYTASHSCIRLFAGVEPSADTAALHRLADALLNPDGRPLPGSGQTPVPCAMLNATPKLPNARPQEAGVQPAR